MTGEYQLGAPKYGRNPFASEVRFFRENPNVGGMAAEDNNVVMNPFSRLSDDEQQSVYKNEMARLLMRTGAIEKPQFLTTDQQNSFFGKINNGQSYGPRQDILETIAARLASGDASAQTPTLDQLIYSNKLRGLLGYWRKSTAMCLLFYTNCKPLYLLLL